MNSRLKPRLVLALLAAAVLAGCSSMSGSLDRINPFSSSDKGKKEVPLPALDNPVELALNWKASAGEDSGAGFAPAVIGKAVTAASAGGSIVRLENGAEAWRIKAKQALSAGVGADGEHVAVGTAKGMVLVYDARGELFWSAQASSEILAAPVYHGNLLIVRTADNRISAFDRANGKRLWTYQRPLPALSLRNATGLLLSDSIAYAGFSGGKLVALGLSNGAPLWESTVALPKGTTELDRIADINSDPAMFGREICAASYRGRVACFDIGTGETLWARDVSTGGRGLAMDGQRVYFVDDNGVVVALDRETGASVWKQDKLAGQQLSAPALAAGHLVAGDAHGNLHLLRKADGTLAGRMPTDGSAILTQPKMTEAGLIVTTARGGIYSFAP